jgi:hypothetical protein
MLKRFALDSQKNAYFVTKSLELKKPFNKDNNKDWDAAIVRTTYGDFKKGNQQGASKDVKVPADNEDI